jgi:hypothetical protein
MDWKIIERCPPDEVEHFIYSHTFWLDQIRIDENGYYQKCDSCDVVGRSRFDLDVCPICGGPLGVDAVLAFGGLIVYCIHHDYFFFHDREKIYLGRYVRVEPADAAEVVAFMARRLR